MCRLAHRQTSFREGPVFTRFIFTCTIIMHKYHNLSIITNPKLGLNTKIIIGTITSSLILKVPDKKILLTAPQCCSFFIFNSTKRNNFLIYYLNIILPIHSYLWYQLLIIIFVILFAWLKQPLLTW